MQVSLHFTVAKFSHPVCRDLAVEYRVFVVKGRYWLSAIVVFFFDLYLCPWFSEPNEEFDVTYSRFLFFAETNPWPSHQQIFHICSEPSCNQLFL